MIWLLVVLIAWCIGGIPFGVLIARSRGVDIRAHGSGNIGATNVARVLGRRWGLLCFGLDAAKGAVPVVVAGVWLGPFGRDPLELEPIAAWGWMAAAAATVAGHMASPFLRFQGGKGVATAAGAMAAAWPLLTVPIVGALVTWGLVLAAGRWVSLASVAAAASLPFWLAATLAWRVHDGAAADGTAPTYSLVALAAPAAMTVLVASAVLWRHRSNLARLRAGTEPKIGARRDPAPDSAN